MLKGIYSAAAGMTSQMIQTDVTANNLANLNTPGFKRVSLEFKTFGDALVKRIGTNPTKELGHYAQGSQVLKSVTNFSQGDMTQTGNVLDMSLKGDGFFTVRIPGNDATVYTRAGSFSRDEEGFLITPDGGRVQGYNGDILIPREAKKIVISAGGDIQVDDRNIAKLKIAQFQDQQKLEHIGSAYFKTLEDPTLDPQGVTVEQGYLERSNSNVIQEMVNNITGLRVYETMQRTIQMQSETLGKAVNDVGRVS